MCIKAYLFFIPVRCLLLQFFSSITITTIITARVIMTNTPPTIAVVLSPRLSDDTIHMFACAIKELINYQKFWMLHHFLINLPEVLIPGSFTFKIPCPTEVLAETSTPYVSPDSRSPISTLVIL